MKLGGFIISNSRDRKNEQERLYNKEQKHNPTGTFNDTVNKVQSGIPNTSGMNFKEVGGVILLLVIIFVGYSLYNLFF